MPTKTAGKGLQRVTSRVWYVTDPDKPRPREHTAKGAEPCCCFREEEEKTRGARNNLFIWIAILSSNDSNGFTSFKINVLKQRILILSVSVSATVSAHTLHLSLSLSLSLIQIVRSAPTNCSNYTLIFTQLLEALYMDTRAVAVLYWSFNQDKNVY